MYEIAIHGNGRARIQPMTKVEIARIASSWLTPELAILSALDWRDWSDLALGLKTLLKLFCINLTTLSWEGRLKKGCVSDRGLANCVNKLVIELPPFPNLRPASGRWFLLGHPGILR